MNFEQTIKDIQDTLTVMGEIERRQSAILREHSEVMHEYDVILHKHSLHLDEIAEYRRRTDQNLAEITDKLNGLIGYMDGQRPPLA